MDKFFERFLIVVFSILFLVNEGLVLVCFYNYFGWLVIIYKDISVGEFCLVVEGG